MTPKADRVARWGHTTDVLHTPAGAVAWCVTDHERLDDPTSMTEAEMTARQHRDETAA